LTRICSSLATPIAGPSRAIVTLGGGVEGPSVVRSDYLAYFGRYELDTENGLVRHFLEGQLHPGNHPATLERTYRFYGDKLSLEAHDGTDRETLWQRA
jgi:Lipocalin-like domain